MSAFFRLLLRLPGTARRKLSTQTLLVCWLSAVTLSLGCTEPGDNLPIGKEDLAPLDLDRDIPEPVDLTDQDFVSDDDASDSADNESDEMSDHVADDAPDDQPDGDVDQTDGDAPSSDGG